MKSSRRGGPCGRPSDLDPELDGLLQHEVPRLHWFALDRRRFLQIFGGGIAIGIAAPKDAFSQESGQSGRRGQELPKDLSAWILIDKDGKVTVFTGKAEVGQNIRTSLAQAVAEELRVPVGSIRMVMGDTELCPFDMGTFGSRTTPYMAPQLRAAAATAREELIDLGAKRWSVGRDTLTAADGKIVDSASKRSLTYGQITRGEKLVKTLPAEISEVQLTPAADWKIAGTPVPKVDGKDFVTGVHRYASDIKRPGMLFGKVLRAPAFETKLVDLDPAKTQALSGVQVVRDGDFAGIVAPDAYTAERAIEALTKDAKWSETPAQPSNATIFEYLKQNVEPAEGERAQPRTKGDIAQAMASAEVTLSRTYTVEYIAHAPLEPRAAVAEWKGDKLTVWTGTQRSFGVREELATALRIPAENVRVIVPDTGSAYGGKHSGDAAVEAARLSKAAGKPVKVVWTREEEFTWAYHRPAGVIEVKSGARKDATLVAWEFHNYNSGPAAIATPYDVANQLIQYHSVKSPLRQGSYRALAATANHFARESHMDELAHELAMDPLAFRMRNLSDVRLRAVFDAAADKFGWASRRKDVPMRGYGIAGGVEKGGYLALCAEVHVDGAPPNRHVTIRRITAAFECGAIVNPDGLRNQVEGAIVQGIGGALFEAIRFENGKILNPHFSQYRHPRFADVPPIDVVLLDRKDLPSAGGSETPIVALAPAVAAGIFEATGERRRELPLEASGTSSGKPRDKQLVWLGTPSTSQVT